MSYTDEDYWFEMKYRDLPEQQREILDLIGYEAYENLVNSFGGCYIRPPRINDLTRPLRDKKILEDYYKGISYKELADRYGVTVNRIYSIIRKSQTMSEGQKDD